MCAGPMVYQGALGSKHWYRCRNCGINAVGPNPCEVCEWAGDLDTCRLCELYRSGKEDKQCQQRATM